MEALYLQITWDVSPELIRIGNFSIRWYGMLFALGFLIGYFFFQHVFKKENVPLHLIDKLALYIIIGAVAGARLGHCLFYQPDYYLANPIEILMIWRGGLASHGGALGIIISLGLFLKKYKSLSFLWLLDRIAVPTALAGCFIRIGNLFNSEILGAPSNAPWAFIFVQRPDIDPVPRHPAQLYEAGAYLLIFILLYLLYRKLGAQTKHGLLIGLFFILVFSARFIIEFFKEIQVPFEEGLTLNMGQLLSIPFVLTGIAMVIYSFRSGKSGSGFIAKKRGKRRTT
jgi:phosphatidylglycerol---prolipoprotein diacylglyceryl transferase